MGRNWLFPAVFTVLVLVSSVVLADLEIISRDSSTNNVVNLESPTPPTNYSLFPTVNSSDYWDNLDTPADISTGDLTDDNTYVEVAGDSMTGNLIIHVDQAEAFLVEDTDGQKCFFVNTDTCGVNTQSSTLTGGTINAGAVTGTSLTSSGDAEISGIVKTDTIEELTSDAGVTFTHNIFPSADINFTGEDHDIVIGQGVGSPVLNFLGNPAPLPAVVPSRYYYGTSTDTDIFQILIYRDAQPVIKGNKGLKISAFIGNLDFSAETPGTNFTLSAKTGTVHLGNLIDNKIPDKIVIDNANFTFAYASRLSGGSPLPLNKSFTITTPLMVGGDVLDNVDEFAIHSYKGGIYNAKVFNLTVDGNVNILGNYSSNNQLGLTGNYSTGGGCWQYFTGGILTSTNCSSA